jgi:hypothetical protein
MPKPLLQGPRSKEPLVKRRPAAPLLAPEILEQIKKLVANTGKPTDPPSKKGGEAPIPLGTYYASAEKTLKPTKAGESMSTETISNVPKVWKSAPKHPPAYLVYVTAEEAEILRAIDLHKSGVGKKMHYGPLRIPSLQGDGPGGSDGGGGGPDGGGGASDGPGSGAGADASGTSGGGGTGVGNDSNGGGTTGGNDGTGDREGHAGGPGAPSGQPGGPGPADGGRDVGPAPHSNPDISAALEAASQAGVFGGIGSPDPNAAMSALNGLNAVGLGSAANPSSAFGKGFANAVASIMSQTPLGSVMSNNPLSTGFSLAGLATPPGISTAIGLAGVASKALDGTLGSTSVNTGGYSGPSPSDAGQGAGYGGEVGPQAPVTGGTGTGTGTGTGAGTGTPTAGGGGTNTPSGWTPPNVTSPNVPVASNPLLPAPDTYANAFNEFGANRQQPQQRLEAYIDASGRIAYRYV